VCLALLAIYPVILETFVIPTLENLVAGVGNELNDPFDVVFLTWDLRTKQVFGYLKRVI
jgi:hypothetical protein